MSQTLQKSISEKIMSSVPFERGFHFSTEEGSYTGVTAISLPDFALKLETIDLKSILFHYPRGDFQKWIEETLGDKPLADRMCYTKPGISGEQLRKQLTSIVQKRIRELET